MNYLVADDSSLARKMIIKVIKEQIDENANIVEATNGKEAYEMYKHNDIKVAFLDLTMPVFDGFQAIQLIRSFDKNAKVIIVSADVQQGSILKAKELGALEFIKKPINEEKVKDIIKNL